MNTKTKLRIEAFRDIPSGSIGIVMMKHTPDGKTFAVSELVWRDVDLSTYIPPTISFSRVDGGDAEAIQQLADSLWDAGVRPSQVLGTAGEKQAMAAHLADFRALAAHALKVQLPNLKTQ